MANTYPYIHPVYERWSSGVFGLQGRANSYWSETRKKDPTLSSLVMCIELIFGDDVIIRIATMPVNVTCERTGEVIFYQPLLGSEPEIGIEVGLGEAQAKSRTISISLPNSIVDAATLIKNGNFLAGMGEVSLQIDQGEYDNRIVMMRGTVDSGVTFDTIGGTVDFSITDPYSTIDQTIPPYLLQKNDFTYITVEGLGSRIPLILNNYPYSPAEFYHYNPGFAAKVMAGYSHNLTVEKLYFDGDEISSTDTMLGWAVVQEVVGDIPYTGVVFNSPINVEGTESVYLKLKVDSPYNDSRGYSSTVDPRTLIEHIEYISFNYTALGRSGMDEFLFALASQKYGKQQSSVCINAGGKGSTTSISYIESGLLPEYPMVSMAYTGGGYGPVVIDRRGKLYEANYIVGQYPIIDRASVVQESPKSSLFNNFIIQYNYSAIDDVYGGLIHRNALNNDLCQLSRQFCGERPQSTMQLITVFEDEVATNIADWLVSHMTLPHYFVEYDAYPGILLDMYLGANIYITDDDFGWVQVPATIVSFKYQRGKVRVGIIVWYFYYSIGGSSADATFPTSVGSVSI
jgi:hypothetical protein